MQESNELPVFISNEAFNGLQPGDIISYYLRFSDNPTNPQKVWTGVIMKINHLALYAIVDVLTEGWEGEEEYVLASQIIRYESVHEG